MEERRLAKKEIQGCLLGGCVVRRRFFACSALRLPSVVKVEQERG
jgi:hypothetical protein